MSTLKKTYKLLSRTEQKQGLWILGLAVGLAFFETAGVASIMPFLAVLGNPSMIESNSVLKMLYGISHRWGVKTTDEFLVALGVGAFVLIVIVSLYRTFASYAMNRFVQMRRHSIGSRLLESYLRQPYAFFISRHSGDMSKSILSEVDHVIGNVLVPAYSMVSYGLVFIAVTALLIAINPWLAMSAAGLLVGLYALVHLAIRNRLTRLGSSLGTADRNRFMAAIEALGGIKDIKLLGRERSYLSKFDGPSKEYSNVVVAYQFLNQMPKNFIEAFAFGGIVAIVIGLLVTGGGHRNNGLGEILPIVGLYAFAAYRLQPALQSIFQGFASLRFGKVAVDNLYADIDFLTPQAVMPYQTSEKVALRKAITLEHLTYFYPQSDKSALSDLNLEIPVGSSVGLIGSTGAGKTTLVDVLLGLLRPTTGRIAVDGVPITESSLHAWQRSLGYVPQEIFFTDASIAENIAFGVPSGEIDYEQVVRCASLAQVHDFIINDLPEKYATLVGERGVRLSGGQRQRIGIARALYRDPDVLVLDEATSALDVVTEQAVMDAIEALAHKKTIVLIAHRLNTVKTCDLIVVLERGRIKAQGKFDDLMQMNEQYQAISSMRQPSCS